MFVTVTVTVMTTTTEMVGGTLLYVGAGTDIRRALNIATATQTIVLMDSQPYSEFGKLLCGELRSDGSDGYSRPKFTGGVAKQFKKHGLEIDPLLSTDTTWVGKRAGRVVLTYHMSTSIPEDLQAMSPHLLTVETLLVRGHHPHVELLRALPKGKLHFVGGYGTSYADDDDESDTLVYWLHHDEATRAAFLDFEYRREDGTSVLFKSWATFAMASRMFLSV